MKGDAASAPTTTGAFKISQLAIVLQTLHRAVLGAGDNYAQDYSVRVWSKDLTPRVREVSVANGCPP